MSCRDIINWMMMIICFICRRTIVWSIYVRLGLILLDIYVCMYISTLSPMIEQKMKIRNHSLNQSSCLITKKSESRFVCLYILEKWLANAFISNLKRSICCVCFQRESVLHSHMHLIEVLRRTVDANCIPFVSFSPLICY